MLAFFLSPAVEGRVPLQILTSLWNPRFFFDSFSLICHHKCILHIQMCWQMAPCPALAVCPCMKPCWASFQAKFLASEKRLLEILQGLEIYIELPHNVDNLVFVSSSVHQKMTCPTMLILVSRSCCSCKSRGESSHVVFNGHFSFFTFVHSL